MPISVATIPDRLREYLEALAPVLVEQGVVQRHRKIYRLRYRLDDPLSGRRIHHSVRLGPDPALAQAVVQHIAIIREKATEKRLISATEAARERALAREKEEKERRANRLFQMAEQAANSSQPMSEREAMATLVSILHEFEAQRLKKPHKVGASTEAVLRESCRRPTALRKPI